MNDNSETDLLCNYCKKANLIIVPGSETEIMLECPECKNYCYSVGNILCTGPVKVDVEKGTTIAVITAESEKRVLELLAGNKLKPEFEKIISSFRKAVGGLT